jgi:hypothetical protein
MHFVKSTIGLAAAGLLLAAVPAYAAGNRVSLGDDYYNPKVKTVSKGTRVVWVNTATTPTRSPRATGRDGWTRASGTAGW